MICIGGGFLLHLCMGGESICFLEKEKGKEKQIECVGDGQASIKEGNAVQFKGVSKWWKLKSWFGFFLPTDPISPFRVSRPLQFALIFFYLYTPTPSIYIWFLDVYNINYIIGLNFLGCSWTSTLSAVESDDQFSLCTNYILLSTLSLSPTTCICKESVNVT